MQCPKCRTANAGGQTYCQECGDALELHCPRCKTRVLPSHRYCSQCGLNLSRENGQTGLAPVEPDGERTHVTVIFSDICGYTALSDALDPEQVRDISGRIFGEVAAVITGYRGFIEKFIGDAVLAVFGLPAVHEDDPLRAVDAAREIHRRVQSIRPSIVGRRGFRLRMHSGIHTGLVVTGGAIPEQGIHGMVGDTLNLASRLADLARPDEILVSSRTHRLISAYYETEPLKPVKPKGLSRLVHPFRILREKDVKTRFDAAKRHGLSAFTGRIRELGALHDRLGQTLAGKGRIVTITGEPGMGKSRLAYEFCHTIDRQRVTVLQARCHAYGSNTPFLPLLDALKRYFSLNDEDAAGQLQNKIVGRIQAIDPALETYLPLVLHLLSIPSDAYRPPENLVGRKFKSAVNESLATMILLYARRKPTVLVLEDWHWADDASHSILMHLASLMESVPLMLLVLYRPERAVEWPAWHYRSACVLNAMDRQNTGRIIQSVWNVDILPQGFASLIHDHTGGNPFFIEEMMTATDSVLALRFFYALYAECLALNGHYGEAESTNKKAMALGRYGQKWGEIAGCRTQAVLAAAANDPDWDRVEALMRECIVTAEESGAVTELVLSIRRHADLMRSKGDEDTAQAYYRRCRQLAGRLGGRTSTRIPIIDSSTLNVRPEHR